MLSSCDCVVATGGYRMSREVSIRQCVVGHENALSLVGQATFLETFSGIVGGGEMIVHCEVAHAPTTYRQWLEDGKCSIWLATIEPGQAPVGYLVLAPAKLPVPSVAGDDLQASAFTCVGGNAYDDNIMSLKL
jgi:hypothetical protein